MDHDTEQGPRRSYDYLMRVPTFDEHRVLARSVGWDDHFDWASLPASLAGSMMGVVAIAESGAPAGMGRLVGDGVHYFYVQDLIVHPAHSDNGVGPEMLSRLLDWVAETIPARAFVGLFASDAAMGMYENSGFGTAGPTGMHRFLDPAT